MNSRVFVNRKEHPAGSGMADGAAPFTLEGIVIPIRWDDQGTVLGVALSTRDEKEYLVHDDEKGRELLPFARREITVVGRVAAQGKQLILYVDRFRPAP